MHKEEFSIIGMHCAACVGRVEKAVSKLDGVEDVKVNLLTNKGTVTYTEGSTIGAAEVIAAIEKIGFEAHIATDADMKVERAIYSLRCGSSHGDPYDGIHDGSLFMALADVIS